MFDLDEIVASIQDGDGHTGYYINTRTDSIIIRSDRFPQWEQREIDEMLDQDFDSIIKLPIQRDAKEFNMMRSFMFQLPNGPAKEALMGALKGQGAFRRFREVCRNYHLLDDWYDFRDNEYANFARDWCIANNIPFTEIPKIYYRHCSRNDADLLTYLKKKELGLAEEDRSMDAELNRYYSHQLRVNGLYQVLAWCKRDVVACGGISFFFIPPTTENPKGRTAWLVDFWCDPEFEEYHCEEVILKKLLSEASRRHIYWVYGKGVRGLSSELLKENGFAQTEDIFYQELEHEPIVLEQPKEEVVEAVETPAEQAATVESAPATEFQEASVTISSQEQQQPPVVKEEENKAPTVEEKLAEAKEKAPEAAAAAIDQVKETAGQVKDAVVEAIQTPIEQEAPAQAVVVEPAVETVFEEAAAEITPEKQQEAPAVVSADTEEKPAE